MSGNDPRGPWTPELVERLRHLWEVDKLSARAIALHLGLSKGQVIGKAHRIGCTPRAPAIKRTTEPVVTIEDARRRRRARPKPEIPWSDDDRQQAALSKALGPRPPKVELHRRTAKEDEPMREPASPPEPNWIEVETDDGRTVRIRRRDDWGCQWIEGDPRIDPTMCGKPRQVLDGGSASYCPKHQARCEAPRPKATGRRFELLF